MGGLSGPQMGLNLHTGGPNIDFGPGIVMNISENPKLHMLYYISLGDTWKEGVV